PERSGLPGDAGLGSGHGSRHAERGGAAPRPRRRGAQLGAVSLLTAQGATRRPARSSSSVICSVRRGTRRANLAWSLHFGGIGRNAEHRCPVLQPRTSRVKIPLLVLGKARSGAFRLLSSGERNAVRLTWRPPRPLGGS